MDLLKKVAGVAIGLFVGYFVVQLFIGGDKLAPFKDFRSSEGAFNILMPGTPKTQNQTLETPVGKVPMTMYMSGSGSAGCAVAFADYPQQIIDSTDPQKLLEGAKNGAISNVNGKLVSETKVSFNGLPARDVVIEVPGKAFITARFILAGPRFYELMLIAPKAKGHEQDISQFFNSFKIDGVK
jgi:hypothetical protein